MLERDKSSVVTMFETEYNIAATKARQQTKYIRYTHAFGERVVFLEHGGGPWRF